MAGEGSEGLLGNWRGIHLPIKMHRFQNKGVAERAFCKLLNGKGMDGSKLGQIWTFFPKRSA